MKKTIIATAVAVALTGIGVTPAAASLKPAPVAPAVHQQLSLGAPSAAIQCSPYPGSVYTVTTSRLRKHRVERGEPNKAVANVRSQTRAEPRGTVKLTLERTNSGPRTVRRLYLRLDEGVAKFALPRHLRVGRYVVRAKYFPRDCSRWVASQSGIDFLRVTR